MNPFTAEMAALDKRAGRIHTTTDWRRVGEKSQRAPEALTDDEILRVTQGTKAKGWSSADATRTAPASCRSTASALSS
jgi:hypothetical protein